LAVCWAEVGVTARKAAITTRLKSGSLIDEHDGDTVLDGINEPALVADELFLGLGLVFEFVLALRTD
jgi:hypothetical protein